MRAALSVFSQPGPSCYGRYSREKASTGVRHVGQSGKEDASSWGSVVSDFFPVEESASLHSSQSARHRHGQLIIVRSSQQHTTQRRERSRSSSLPVIPASLFDRCAWRMRSSSARVRWSLAVGACRTHWDEGA